MYAAFRDALFRLEAERSHELTTALLSHFPRLAGAFSPPVPAQPLELLGLHFRNPVGLAAGLDKNGECIEAYERMGFGFVEIGTVTPRPQPGNPPPRLFRIPEHQALVNRLGFNSRGAAYVARRLERSEIRSVLGINIGKNRDTPLERAADDYVACLAKLYRWAAYVTINVSSPNTPDLRELQGREPLRALLRALAPEREALAQRHGRRAPLLVKVSPDLDGPALAAVAAVAREEGVDGLIATNTTVRRPLADSPQAREAGGLSGAPLRPLALQTVRALRQSLGAGFPLIGVGGICGGADALERRKAGADLVQVYTGLIYRGPGLIAECVRALMPPSAARPRRIAAP